MLSEIIENLLILLGGKNSQVTEAKTNKNLKILRNEQWFQSLFSENMELFMHNRELRYVIGAAKLQTVLDNPKKKQRFEEDLTHLINLIEKNTNNTNGKVKNK